MWAEGISDFLVNLIINVVIPLLALAGIVLAIVGFFKLMSSEKDEDLKSARNYILWWIAGVIIMISAAWIVMQLVWADGTWGIVGDIISEGQRPSWAQVASDIYRKIAYPLIRVVLNIILGIMFIIAVVQWFKYLFSGNDEIQKKAVAILVYTTVGILIVILAKTLVEITYGKYEDVVNVEVRPWGQDLWQIGDGVFEDPQLDTLYVILNWILWLATFIVTILIMYIWYLLLVQPTSEENTTKLKKTIVRALGWILLIGVAYLIANFVIIT